ncbi:carboxylesterase family protein, partial [Singulisphaera rosea]
MTRLQCRRCVLPTFGAFLLARGAAGLHQWNDIGTVASWSLLVLSEFELYGGLALLAGLVSPWARLLGVGGLVALMRFSFVPNIMGQGPWSESGTSESGDWLGLGGDLIAFALLLRGPIRGWEAGRFELAPRRTAMLAFFSLVVGVAIDREHVGRYPVVRVLPSTPLDYRYLVYLPKGYSWSTKRWPLILFLHGAGTIGHDVQKLRQDGLARRAEETGTLPFVIVAPQSPSGGWSIEVLDDLLDQVLARYRIDPDRVCLTGSSMGGYGTWSLATTHPE